MSVLSVWDEMWRIVAADPASIHCKPVRELLGDPATPLVRAVYKGEPVTGYQEEGTIGTVTPGSGDADYHNIVVRFYAVVGQRPVEAQIAVVEAYEALEEIMTDRFERPEWVSGLNEQLGCWVLEATYPGPRE